MPRFIDTHCHPYLNEKKDTDKIINNFFEDEWEVLVSIWTDLETTKKSLELAKKHKNIFCTIWIHPCDVFGLDLEKTIDELEKIYLENKQNIVWIWETWLDYYWMSKENISEEKLKEKKLIQKIFFVAQIKLAEKYNLPFVIHNRDSKDDVLEIIKQTWYKNFIFHCYSEDYEYAKKILDFAPDCFISFSGIVTFKNAKTVQETALNIPTKNILWETDAPYLTPTPFRWKEENEPMFTKYVIEYIADLRNEEKNDFFEKIFSNSKKVFSLDI